MNIYYQADQLGLEIVGELDDPNACYSFDTFLVLKHVESGRVFWATDAGCSCPTPFADYKFKSPDDNNLTEVKNGHEMEVFESELENHCNRLGIKNDEKDALIGKVRGLV